MRGKNDQWPRVTLKRYGSGYLLLAFIVYLLAVDFYVDLKTKGYCLLHWSPPVYGDDAYVMIILFLLGGTICLIKGIDSFVLLKKLIKNKCISENKERPAKYVVYTSCSEEYLFSDVNIRKMRCKKCHGNLVDFNYYHKIKKANQALHQLH